MIQPRDTLNNTEANHRSMTDEADGPNIEHKKKLKGKTPLPWYSSDSL